MALETKICKEGAVDFPLERLVFLFLFGALRLNSWEVGIPCVNGQGLIMFLNLVQFRHKSMANSPSLPS